MSNEYIYPLCDINKQSISYHNKIKNIPSKYEEIKCNIIEIFFNSNETYGYRRIYNSLSAKFDIGINTVLKLMNEMNLYPYIKRKHYNSFKGDMDCVFPNLVNRNFFVNRPYELLFSDITMIKTPYGDLYLSPVIDAFNNEILYYNLSEKADKNQAIDTFTGLSKLLPKSATPILHTDQGWQYKNSDIRKIISSACITQSMSRKGNCLDNARMESWFGRFKTELIYIKKNYSSLNDIKDAIHNYIKFYNEKRIQSRLNWMSPIDYKSNYENKFINIVRMIIQTAK
ncbi:MAG: IS3 family transposase [Treponema sp.]|nr:IS3 family transposase [Treponema sp.]